MYIKEERKRERRDERRRKEQAQNGLVGEWAIVVTSCCNIFEGREKENKVRDE